jgi:hypothetical protein
MRVATILLALAVAACEVLTGPDYPDTTIRVSGTVVAAGDGSPIVGTEIVVYMQRLEYQEFMAGAQTDSLGHYSLSYVEEGYCPEVLIGIRASATGFQTVDYTHWGYEYGNDPTHIRCTEETQTVDFQLEQAP